MFIRDLRRRFKGFLPVGVGGTRDLGGGGVYPTESCHKVALPDVYCLLYLIGVVVLFWSQLEVDAFCPEEIFEGLGALVFKAEGKGFEAPVEQVLVQLYLRSQQLLGCVFF